MLQRCLRACGARPSDRVVPHVLPGYGLCVCAWLYRSVHCSCIRIAGTCGSPVLLGWLSSTPVCSLATSLHQIVINEG